MSNPCGANTVTHVTQFSSNSIPMCNSKNDTYIHGVTLLHMKTSNLKKSLYMCNSVFRRWNL